jgi:hypothetical protein
MDVPPQWVFDLVTEKPGGRRNWYGLANPQKPTQANPARQLDFNSLRGSTGNIIETHQKSRRSTEDFYV